MPTFKSKFTGAEIEENLSKIPQMEEDIKYLQENGTGSGGTGGITQETDPTVPAWAKATTKPAYTKSEVGLGNVDNVKQYSASNPPPYPVTSVNEQTGAVNISVPTKTSDLTNNSGFITKAVSDLANYYLKTQTYTKEEVNGLVSAIPKFAISVVSSLPTSGISTTTIYLVGGGETGNLYTEYIYVNSKWEILGSQKVDLTGYATESWVNTKLGDYLLATELTEAINTALAQAKESGEFDGRDGNGIANTRFNADGTLTLEYEDGTEFTTPTSLKGESGESVSIKSITEVEIDGAANTVEFSDGKTLSIKNGSKGTDGKTPVKGVDYFDGEDGAPGADGERGTGILKVTTSPTSYTTATGGKNPIKRMAISTIKTQAGVDEVLVGDLISYSYYLYHIYYLDATYAYMDNYVSIRGATGAAGTNGTDGKDGKDYSFDPTVYGLPILELEGDISPIAVSKDNKVTLTYVYGDRSGTCTLKGQGATSYKKAQELVNAGKAGKFNYTINFDNAFEAATGWGSQKKYCLKANWIDHSHSRNVVSAKIWGKIVKSRTTANANLSGLVNGGAVDGFPIVIMLNGEFHGLYTFNIPKDGWMFGLVEDTTKTQAVFGANDHELATQFKGLLAGDESDFELEFVSDENNTAWATTSLNTLIQSCIDSWGGDLDTTVAQYLDWDSAIDYLIWVVVCKGTDMVDKNYLLTTFDGTKWVFTAYDMDSTYGLNWDGSGLTRPVSNINFEECANINRVFELIKRFKTNELKARYNSLRADTLSESRMCQLFENFAWAIPSPVAIEDVKLYPTVPGSFVNGIDQIARFINMRLEQCDKWINALPAQETPVEPEEPEEIINQVPISTDTDGSIYNGTGYKDNARLSSSGGVSGTAQSGSVTTGFIPWEWGDIIRMKGATWLGNASQGHWYINFYNSSKTFITGGGVPVADYEAGHYAGHLSVTYDSATEVTTFSLDDLSQTTGLTYRIKDAKYFRINAKGSGSDLIITINQEIT